MPRSARSRGYSLRLAASRSMGDMLGACNLANREATVPSIVSIEEPLDIPDAIAAERRIKGWSRAKKEALIRGDYEQIRALAKRSG
ncbi:MAG: GIY-YIG nuclease family protein [Reyranellaceae bacterium]